MALAADRPVVTNRATGMEWFYQILDVEYGIEMAVRDARRVTTWQAALFGVAINVMLLAAFALVWVRYDLWSTATVFLPVKENILTVVPTDGNWATVKWVLSLILGLASAFFTSLIQWAYARFAARHQAALWGLAGACLFDIATDYIDVSRDFPAYFAPIIASAATVSVGWWLAAGVLFIAGAIIWRGNLSLYLILAGACFAAGAGNAETVITWLIIFVGTIFASFVAQSLTLIHAAKCLALLGTARELRATAD